MHNENDIAIIHSRPDKMCAVVLQTYMSFYLLLLLWPCPSPRQIFTNNRARILLTSERSLWVNLFRTVEAVTYSSKVSITPVVLYSSFLCSSDTQQVQHIGPDTCMNRCSSIFKSIALHTVSVVVETSIDQSTRLDCWLRCCWGAVIEVALVRYI